MADVLIIGDDLTGSNGAATGLARRGLRTVTLRVGEAHEQITAQRELYDAVVVTTDSRHAPAAEAARRTAASVRAGWPASFVASRCDSTLRGNVGAEAEAVIATVRSLTDREVIGLCMPAFPTADRQTVGGLQLMGGVRLEHTELARDVRTPMTSSSVAAALTRDSGLTCAEIDLEAVTAGGAALEERIAQLLDGDDASAHGDSSAHSDVTARPDILIGDALTDVHLREIARAALAVRPQALWIGIDPGPGSWALVEQMGLTAPTGRPGTSEVPPLLAVSGSATELTRTQLADVTAARDVAVIRPVFAPGTHRMDVTATSREVLRALHAASAPVVLLATVLEPADIVDLTEAEADAIPAALGAVTAAVLSEAAVGGLYTTGGDVTAEVLDGLGGVGIEVFDEVVPLATAGTVAGGPHAGLPIVTKGGLVGGTGTAGVCLDALAELAAARAEHRSTLTLPTTEHTARAKDLP